MSVATEKEFLEGEVGKEERRQRTSVSLSHTVYRRKPSGPSVDPLLAEILKRCCSYGTIVFFGVVGFSSFESNTLPCRRRTSETGLSGGHLINGWTDGKTGGRRMDEWRDVRRVNLLHLESKVVLLAAFAAFPRLWLFQCE